MKAGGRLTQTQFTNIAFQSQLHRKIEAYRQEKIKNDSNARLRQAKSMHFVSYMVQGSGFAAPPRPGCAPIPLQTCRCS